MIKINSKLPNLGTTIFTVIGKLAKEHNAINLSQGFPNFSPDSKLLQLVNKAHQNDFNQYAPMQGALNLRETISKKTESLYGTFYHPETEITITAGATQAIFTSIAAFIQPKDEVIVLRPAYDCYEPAIQLFGGVVVPIALEGSSFEVDWNAIKRAISSKTRMIIINTPHNPTGTIWSEADMLQLQEILEGTNIILLSDEVYEHIYLGPESYTWHCLKGNEKGLCDTDYCRFRKIDDNLYLFVWQEKIVPTTGALLLDFNAQRSCGKIVGYQGREAGELCNFKVGAKAVRLNCTAYPCQQR